MNESRLSIRVDPKTKRRAENVFNTLGMSLSTGVNIYLTRVAAFQSIPFPLEVDNLLAIESRMKDAVRSKTAKMKADNTPVALYDDELKRPYLEYPDGRREYDID